MSDNGNTPDTPDPDAPQQVNLPSWVTAGIPATWDPTLQWSSHIIKVPGLVADSAKPVYAFFIWFAGQQIILPMTDIGLENVMRQITGVRSGLILP